MTHEHGLPKTFSDIQECATELYAIITQQVEADYIETAAHAYWILGYVLHVLGADKANNFIGETKEAALQLTAKEQIVLDDCMIACGHKAGPVVGGPLTAWALRVILAKAAEQLLALIDDLLNGKDVVAIEKAWDVSLLKTWLDVDNQPLLDGAITKLLDSSKD